MGRRGGGVGRLRRRLVLLWAVDGRGGGSGIRWIGVLGVLGEIPLLVRGRGACRSRGAFCSLYSGVASSLVVRWVESGLMSRLLRFGLSEI